MKIGIVADQANGSFGLSAANLALLFLEDTEADLFLSPVIRSELIRRFPFLENEARLRKLRTSDLNICDEIYFYDLGRVASGTSTVRGQKKFWMMDHELGDEELFLSRRLRELKGISAAPFKKRSVFAKGPERFRFQSFQAHSARKTEFERALFVFEGSVVPFEDLARSRKPALLIGTLDPEQEDILVRDLSPSRHSLYYIPNGEQTTIPEGLRWVSDVSFCLPAGAYPENFHSLLGLSLAVAKKVSANVSVAFPNLQPIRRPSEIWNS